ncbi:MAG: hypothetical protein ACLGHN_04305 [Bacteriovoracia bacterium]
MKGWINTKTALVFVLSFTIFVLAINGFSYYHEQQHKAQDFRQNHIILEQVKDRFKIFLKSPATVGFIGAEHFSSLDLQTGNYTPFSQKVLKLHDEIIGLNLLDETGKIVRVYPANPNEKARGLVSQNYASILNSYNKGDSFWFSPPFKLFQGPSGFALYFPILKENRLKGWFATVLTTEAFVRDFHLNQFLTSYELIIKDKKTDHPYLATAFEPQEGTRFFQTTASINGRDLVFMSWTKVPPRFVFIPWSWTLIGAFFFSLIFVILLRVSEQKKKIRQQLEDVTVLLKLTSKEALSKLIDLQAEFYKIGSSDTINYVTHLIEQIDLLQTTANTGKEIETEKVDLRTSLLKELDEIRDLQTKKSIQVDFSPEKIVSSSILANRWLLENSVLNTILTHAIVHAEAGSGISIEFQKMRSSFILTIRVQRMNDMEFSEKSINLDRRLMVAKKVLHVFNGELSMDKDLSGGMIIRIQLPASE